MSPPLLQSSNESYEQSLKIEFTIPDFAERVNAEPFTPHQWTSEPFGQGWQLSVSLWEDTEDDRSVEENAPEPSEHVPVVYLALSLKFWNQQRPLDVTSLFVSLQTAEGFSIVQGELGHKFHPREDWGWKKFTTKDIFWHPVCPLRNEESCVVAVDLKANTFFRPNSYVEGYIRPPAKLGLARSFTDPVTADTKFLLPTCHLACSSKRTCKHIRSVYGNSTTLADLCPYFDSLLSRDTESCFSESKMLKDIFDETYDATGFDDPYPYSSDSDLSECSDVEAPQIDEASIKDNYADEIANSHKIEADLQNITLNLQHLDPKSTDELKPASSHMDPSILTHINGTSSHIDSNSSGDILAPQLNPSLNILRSDGTTEDGPDIRPCEIETIEIKVDAVSDSVKSHLTPQVDSVSRPQRLGTVVPVNDVAHKTWVAMFVFLHTGEINFAPLTSSNKSFPDCQSKEEHVGFTPQCPGVVSCKSAYRLADKLGIRELENVSLEYLGSQLTVDNIVTELFSKFTSRYDRVRNVEVQYAVTVWDKISTSPEFTQQFAQFASGSLTRSTSVIQELLANVRPIPIPPKKSKASKRRRASPPSDGGWAGAAWGQPALVPQAQMIQPGGFIGTDLHDSPPIYPVNAIGEPGVNDLPDLPLL